MQKNVCASASSILPLHIRSKPANSITNDLRPGSSWVSLEVKCQNPTPSYVVETRGMKCGTICNCGAIALSFTREPSRATVNICTKEVQRRYFHSTNISSGFAFNSEQLQIISCITKMQNKQSHSFYRAVLLRYQEKTW